MTVDVRALIAQAAAQYGVDPAVLLRIAELESGLDPAARNPRSSAGGLFQFIDGTAAQYGLVDRFNPAQAADAAARLLRDNQAGLRRVLGRDPSGAELYLAHQQGLGGAGKLLANPNAPGEAAVGARAFKLNAGRPGMTAGQFAQLWTDRFNARPGGQRPQQPAQPPAAAPAALPFAAPQQPAAPSGLAALFDPDLAAADQPQQRPRQPAPGTLDPRRRAALLSAQNSAQNPVGFG